MRVEERRRHIRAELKKKQGHSIGVASSTYASHLAVLTIKVSDGSPSTKRKPRPPPFPQPPHAKKQKGESASQLEVEVLANMELTDLLLLVLAFEV